MASRFQIINESLASLSEDPLDTDVLAASARDLQQDGISRHFDDIAATVVAVYPGAKRSILAAHEWSFLEERIMLAGSGAPSADSWPFPHQYRQPDAVGSIRAVYDENTRDPVPRTDEWTAQGGFIYASFMPAWADFVRTDIAEEQLPPLVVDALQAELTARLTMPIREDEPTHRINMGVAAEALNKALRQDAKAHPVVALTGFGYVEAHLGGGMF